MTIDNGNMWRCFVHEFSGSGIASRPSRILLNSPGVLVFFIHTTGVHLFSEAQILVYRPARRITQESDSSLEATQSSTTRFNQSTTHHE
jgi:hypothetical protein